MLQLHETRIARTKHEVVLSGVQIQEEGMALAFVKENGETKVQPATGAAGEVFAGLSYSRMTSPAEYPHVQEGIVDADGIIELDRAPIGGQLFAKVGGNGLEILTSGTPDAGKAVVSGTTLNVGTNLAGQSYFVQYLFNPSVVEARQIAGDAPIGGLSSSAQGVIGTLKDATAGTTFFDASVDWSSALFVKLAAGGKLTVGSPSNHIPNAVVKNTPQAGSPFLVLSFKTA